MLHLTELTERLRSRDLTSRDLVDAALARIEASGREGPLIFRALAHSARQLLPPPWPARLRDAVPVGVSP